MTFKQAFEKPKLKFRFQNDRITRKFLQGKKKTEKPRMASGAFVKAKYLREI